MYLALYRKYRPKKFAEVIGQDHIIKTLENQIKMDKIGHAYLFCGSRGTGKTSTAKIFAREINCKCNHTGDCMFCKEEPTLDIVEIDAASNNGVDEIRTLRENVKYPPVDGKYRVYIVDEVHMLSPSAFNALLKTLEEPPAHAIFILATTEVHKLPATILSRCMRFDFKLVSVEELSKLLKKVFNNENVDYDEQSIEIIARAGEGSVRDTLSIADRCVSFSAGKLTRQNVVEVLGQTERQTLINLADCLLNKNLGESLVAVNNIFASGKSPLVLSKDMIYYFRDLLLINVLKDKASSMVIASEQDYKEMQKQADDKNYSKIVKIIELLSEVEAELRYSTSPKIVLEECIIKLYSQTSLLERVEKLEKLLAENKQGSKMVAQTQDKLQVASNNTVVEVNDKTIGELLNYLRSEKLMSLLMACRQIKKIAIEKNTAKLYLRDKMAKDMMLQEKQKAVLNKYFADKGLDWQVVDMTDMFEDKTKEISKKLGNIDIK